MPDIMVIYGSSRRKGNTDFLADKVTEGIEVTKVYLKDLTIQPIVDQRHESQGFDEVNDDYESLLNDFLNHDIYIFVTPLYWFGMSAQLKAFFDRWSQYKDNKEWNLKDRIKGKKAYFITAANDEPAEEVTAPLIKQFELICNYIGLNFINFIIGKGSKPNEVKADKKALEKATIIREELRNLKDPM